MAAITWRELTGQNDAAAFQALSNATNTINSGFDTVGKAIAQRQVANQFGFDRDQDAQANAFKQALANAKTQQEVEAIQATRGVALAGLDNARLAPTIGMEDARVKSLQGIYTANQADQQARFLGDNKEQLAQTGILAAQGMPVADILKTLGPNANNPAAVEMVNAAIAARQLADKTQSGIASQGANTTQATAGALLSDAQRLGLPAKALLDARQVAVQEGGLAVQQRQATTAEQNSAQSGLSQMIAMRAEQAQKLGGLDKGTVGTETGFNSLMTNLKGAAESKEQGAKIASIASDAIKSNSEFSKLPTAVVEQIVLSQLQNVGNGFLNMLDPRTDMNSTVSSAIKKDLDAAVKAYAGKTGPNELAADQLRLSLKALGGVTDIAMGKAYPEFQAGLNAAIEKKAAEAATSAGQSKTMSDVQRGGSITSPVKNTESTVFTEIPELETKVKTQEAQMTLGTRRLYTPEVKEYLTKKAANTELSQKESIEESSKRFKEEQRKRGSPTSFTTLSDQIALRADEDAKKAK